MAERKINNQNYDTRVTRLSKAQHDAASTEDGSMNYIPESEGADVAGLYFHTNGNKERIWSLTGSTGSTGGGPLIEGMTTYIAKLTQTGTNAPVIDEIYNDTGLVPVSIYSGVGAYQLRFSANIASRVMVTLSSSNNTNSPSNIKIMNYCVESIFGKSGHDIVHVLVADEIGGTFVGADGVLDDTTIKIEILP